jgi:hypothetical protein
MRVDQVALQLAPEDIELKKSWRREHLSRDWLVRCLQSAWPGSTGGRGRATPPGGLAQAGGLRPPRLRRVMTAVRTS